MSKNLSPGKLAGLEAVSNARGVIAAAAMDQRGLLKKALAEEMRVEVVPEAAIVEFKEIVTAMLARHASAILLDPEYGMPAAKRRGRMGLLLSYEKSAYDFSTPLIPRLYETWTVRRLKEAGANAIKILLYYTPFEKAAVNNEKQAWVERIGDECRANDIPLFFELLGYDVHGEDPKGPAYARRKPEIVSRSMEEFGKERYGVDVMKVEAPVQIGFVEGTRSFRGERVYGRAEALRCFRDAAASTTKPIVYLSAGVGNAEFIEVLELATESATGFSGVLCGRAIWMGGLPVYVRDGAKGLEDWLNGQGAENIRNINRAIERAEPWRRKLGLEEPVPVRGS